MIKLGPQSYQLEFYDRPGQSMTDAELSEFATELKAVANECLDEIPYYQCLTGTREEFSRLVIAVARGRDGKMLGFCSSYILDGGEFGEILHLGLTCVGMSARRMGLTHKLTSKVVAQYLIRHAWFKPVWVSNVACVLSSLGNVALHFEGVYPSPTKRKGPTTEQLAIARLIDQKFRWELYIDKDAKFDEEAFVFRGSVKGNMFQKSQTDTRYHHRNRRLTQFYVDLMNFENGDEVLQIGKLSFMTYPKYIVKKFAHKMRVLTPVQLTN